MTKMPNMLPKDVASPDEAASFLHDNPTIEAIDLVLIDANGIGRGKIIRRHELMGLYERGRHLPISILGLDVAGNDVPETGLIWDEGDKDLRAWPIVGSLCALYGTSPPRAEVMVALYELDGQPMACDPRHALAQQITKLSEQGLQASAAFELEFFLFGPKFGPDRRPMALNALDGPLGRAKTNVYSLEQIHGFLPVFSDIYAACASAQIQAETVISEYAPGQFELTLKYRSNVLAAAQDLVRLKRIVRAQARRHALEACFMAKPLADEAGSGMHMHISIYDARGCNAFAETQPDTWHPDLRHAIGGLRATMGDAMVIFAPFANSWRRFAGELYAPVQPSWGGNNRSVALRVPLSDPDQRRIEHRAAGVDANPYLVATVVLAGLRLGLVKSIDPGPETKGNGYVADVGPNAPQLPADWRDAIAQATQSEFLKTALGPALHRSFLAIKAAEYRAFSKSISDVELDLYFGTV
jgi:glutamine synthetase